MTNRNTAKGPLAGLKVVEVGGVGPGPFCAMLLADMGAEVVRIDRKHASESGLPVDRRFDVMFRGRRSLALDLKKPEAVDAVKRMLRGADVLIEGFRPGVMERLGLGPEVCLELNPRLIYGRMTGWGQTGPLAREAGHDINYIALSGVLHAIGRKGGPPEIPLNLIGDFGGGAMYLAFGIMCALHEAKSSGRGQVVDAAMVDGSTSLMAMVYGLFAAGYWKDERGSNRLDSGAPWYDVYETKDGRYVAVGCTEASFFRNTLRLLGLREEDFGGQHDRDGWPKMKEAFARVFRSRTRDEWCAVFEGTETCFSPVLSLAEAPHHPHQVARGNFVECSGVVQPAPAPRFSRSRPAVQGPPPQAGEHTMEVLKDWGFGPEDVALLQGSGAI
ncbi:L-carnitine dehydratase/bile acid-inducible protein F [Acidovorax delafieldii 2AN]|uniref:L-carnitine dehydratase/bile acid-inducible protein F n=1 Tax=Acidovorax delafieldii 2AN TaxID=573060 RepID=C5T163_ACIDE|nr:CaiB/BaiF CoA-transferase family protein [Acidovorax delafieldii]EER61807.1 L-carnitine dehydratase/bile acid-inducible protein F [Acidovorax delafieldii 2AN]